MIYIFFNLHLDNLIFRRYPLCQKNKYSKITDIELPQSIIESFARFLVPEIQKYYDSEQGQTEFAQWQQEHEHKNQKEDQGI